MDRERLLGLDRAALSCGTPSTSMMRPSVAWPTGTMIGAGGAPRARAQAFRGAHRDGAHHPIAELPLPRTSLTLHQAQGLVDLRHDSRANSTSTTAPMICVICH